LEKLSYNSKINRTVAAASTLHMTITELHASTVWQWAVSGMCDVSASDILQM